MEVFNRKKHWENIYETKSLNEVSWYQPTPQTSLDFILESKPPKTTKIIDVGAGDSFLVDHLLELGFTNITVLDISKTAIERAQKRLGAKAKQVNWVVSDITAFNPKETFDIWHDRAAFHFLTEESDINTYVELVRNAISPKGKLILGTFSTDGPTKCSGIPIKQYSEKSMTLLFETIFAKEQCKINNHSTPFGTTQNFIFCSFKKKL
ncbi:trans-aconitate 2-methyltransferase [Mesonia sp. K7]|uniref:class I SAM-dependent methyltransferase n=1 Tax=Mesonia sp. K7 TaxID=2218606 RepID=UPI000DA7CCDF|nr:class I SAM-dependent methyltransferase [Mesonia sp. K7]PZD79344.1 SAM-dependent methyltransferase [Mesonia sp. K7]